MQEVSENSKFILSLKSIIGIVVLASSLIGGYYSLSMDIQKAMELPVIEIPEPEVTATEFGLRIDLITQTVMSNAEKLDKIETQVDKIEERVYELK